MPRQRFLEQRQRPGLERLRQQRVIRVAESLHRDGPGRVPIQATLVDEEPHQLGNADRRVGIIELHGVTLGKLLHRTAHDVEKVQHVLQRA